MNATLNAMRVLEVSQRDGKPNARTGVIATFVSVTLFDAERPSARPLTCWAFLSDLAELPQQNDTITARVSVRAKLGDFGPYLSVRLLSYENN